MALLNTNWLKKLRDFIFQKKNPEDFAIAQEYVHYSAELDLESYNNCEELCQLVTYGDKRVGGFFFQIIQGHILLIGHPFLQRQLLHENFAADFIKKVLWKKMYPFCDRIELFVPPHLKKSMENLLKALNLTEDPSMNEKYQAHKAMNVGFSGELS